MGVMEKDEMKVEEFEPTLQFTILLYPKIRKQSQWQSQLQ